MYYSPGYFPSEVGDVDVIVHRDRRSCIGLFNSKDGLHWEVQPPFYTPRVSFDFEVPKPFLSFA